MTALKATYPQYFISKNKLTLSPDMDVDKILEGLKKKYASEEITDIDGVKIDFKDGGYTCENPTPNRLSGFIPNQKTSLQPINWRKML